MNSIQSSYFDQKAFSFDMKTSSGDTIHLAYNNETSLSTEQNGKNLEYSFSQTQEFNLHYQGDGIDAQDQKEIKEAMAQFRRHLESFFTSEEGNPRQGVSELVQQMDSTLPLPKDDAERAFQKSALAEAFDALFPKVVAQRVALEEPQSVDVPEESVPDSTATDTPAPTAENEENAQESDVQPRVKSEVFAHMGEILQRLLSTLDQRSSIPMYA